jgi:hypothetical protein
MGLYQRRELSIFVSPIPQTDGHDGFGLIDELVPCLATGLDDGVVVFEDAVREPVLPEVLPDILDRVQLGRARGQEDDGEVLGDLELAGAMPAGTIHQDDGVGLGGDVATDLVEVHLHGAGVGEGQHEGGALAPAGTDGAEQIGVGVALVGGQARACSPLRPNARPSVLLSQSGLVLEPNLDPLGFGQTGYVGRQRAGEVFLNASITRSSCPG